MTSAQTSQRIYIGDVAKLTGWSLVWIRRIDAELQPQRDQHGRRTYDPNLVLVVAGRHAARRRARNTTTAATATATEV